MEFIVKLLSFWFGAFLGIFLLMSIIILPSVIKKLYQRRKIN